MGALAECLTLSGRRVRNPLTGTRRSSLLTDRSTPTRSALLNRLALLTCLTQYLAHQRVVSRRLMLTGGTFANKLLAAWAESLGQATQSNAQGRLPQHRPRLGVPGRAEDRQARPAGQLGREPLRRTYFTMFRRRGSRKNPDNGEDHCLGLED